MDSSILSIASISSEIADQDKTILNKELLEAEDASVASEPRVRGAKNINVYTEFSIFNYLYTFIAYDRCRNDCEGLL